MERRCGRVRGAAWGPHGPETGAPGGRTGDAQPPKITAMLISWSRWHGGPPLRRPSPR